MQICHALVRLVAPSAAAMLVMAAPAAADVHTWFFPLEGSQEVPPVPTTAKGYCVVTLDDVTRFCTVECTFVGLTSNISNPPGGAHIHLGAAGVNGGVILGLSHPTGVQCGRAFGSGTLSVSNANAMLAGNTYVNIHSTSFPGGEIRGQVVDMPEPAPPLRDYRLFLTGDEEVPPVTTNGRGHCYITLNEDTRFMTVDCTYAMLSSNCNGAHVHSGAIGTNGPIMLGLSHPVANCGTATGSGTLSVANFEHVLADNSYMNIHSASNPGGEIRAQLINPDKPEPKCPCPGNVTCDGDVNIFDLLAILSCWGEVVPGCEAADVTGDGDVNIFDLLFVLSNWGPCP